MARRILLGLVIVVALGGAGFLAAAWRPALTPVAPLHKDLFDSDLVLRGAQLARIGNCNVCHTSEGGAPFAGGRPVPTPFGTIHATNITPDPQTGIGRWSEAAFRRSMREGVDRKGRHLYPAFPYDHFTRLTDDDIRAIYAFLMTRRPVAAETPANTLEFPYNLRFLLAGWKFLYLDQGVFKPDPEQSAAWNRGAYLVEGLAHCGACHTPRNGMGAERTRRSLDGGEAENWWAPPLNANSPAPIPWTEQSLFAYLRHWHPKHGSGLGPMRPVVHNLAEAPEEDVRAIAAYIASQIGQPSAERKQETEAIAARVVDDSGPGAVLYAGACATCHESGGAVPFTVRSLAFRSALVSPDPRNVIQVLLNGVEPVEGEAGPIMPAFDGTFTDAQIADLLAYLRRRFSNAPAWTNIDSTIRRVRGDRDRQERGSFE